MIDFYNKTVEVMLFRFVNSVLAALNLSKGVSKKFGHHLKKILFLVIHLNMRINYD